MAKISKTIVDKALRDFIFEDIIPKYPAGGREYVRVNDCPHRRYRCRRT